MKHHEFNRLQTLAKINQAYPHQEIMPRTERLRRWVELLDRDPHRVLSTLQQTEYQPDAVRALLRCDNSAISVAYDDPVLRAAGMENDTYGEARRFFELPDRHLHRIVCNCHFGATVSAGVTACYLRAKHVDRKRGFWARLRAVIAE
ncbi:hypothetical protein [Rhizobium sp. Root1204]|uniref:hypothetical protein n=1 Tax=Rhizobium sp. Root1204 TaxID=1736428 RepID=UPI0007152F3E|nr:hypothetical protein [Rhizobium sp. Root1204]KQV34518.1 hypothetical protein ASC96_30205 [Rhizobium sp. Root1204]